jgi:hypothetical protein
MNNRVDAFLPEGIAVCTLCEVAVPYLNVIVHRYGEPERRDIDYFDDDDWHAPGCRELSDPNCVNGPDCPCFHCGGNPDFDWG